MKVKIFSSANTDYLETEINTFLKLAINDGYEIINVSLSMSGLNKFALVHYKNK